MALTQTQKQQLSAKLEQLFTTVNLTGEFVTVGSKRFRIPTVQNSVISSTTTLTR